MLKYEAPAMYDVIMKMTPKGYFPEPRVDTIERVCLASDDPSLRKAKFFRYLNEYRKKGIYCGRAQTLTPKRARYYESIRQKNLERFVHKNNEIIEIERKIMRAKKGNV